MLMIIFPFFLLFYFYLRKKDLKNLKKKCFTHTKTMIILFSLRIEMKLSIHKYILKTHSI